MLNRKTHQVIMLQETHSTVELAPFWKAEWGHSIIYSHDDSRSRGVAILLKNSLSHEIHSVKTDSKGRYMLY